MTVSVVGDVSVADVQFVVLTSMSGETRFGVLKVGGKAVLRSKEITFCPEERDGLYWLADTCKRAFDGPLRANGVKATKMVTAKTEDGEIL